MSRKWAAFVVGVFMAGSCWAGDTDPVAANIELSLGVGMSFLSPDVAPPLEVTDDTGVSIQAALAQQINEAWQVQFRYADLGEGQVSDTADVWYDAIAITAQYTLPYLQDTAFDINLLIGGAMVDIHASYLSLEDRSSNEPVLGTSLDYEVVKDWRIRLETLAYGQDITSLTLGLAKRF